MQRAVQPGVVDVWIYVIEWPGGDKTRARARAGIMRCDLLVITQVTGADVGVALEVMERDFVPLRPRNHLHPNVHKLPGWKRRRPNVTPSFRQDQLKSGQAVVPFRDAQV